MYKKMEPELLKTMRESIAAQIKGEVEAIEKYHNMTLTIKDIAEKAIWMQSGFIAGYNAVNNYLEEQLRDKKLLPFIEHYK